VISPYDVLVVADTYSSQPLMTGALLAKFVPLRFLKSADTSDPVGV
jgi:hypothetical protein